MIHAFLPLMLEAVRQNGENPSGDRVSILLNAVENCIANQLVSPSLTLAGRADKAARLAGMILQGVEHGVENRLSRVKSGNLEGVDVMSVDLKTGQSQPFDFRDHLKMDGAS
jgi:hypothetical protein